MVVAVAVVVVVAIAVVVVVAACCCPPVPDEPARLRHEELDVHKVGIEFLALAAGLLDRYPRAYGALAEQLSRAALSIPLNIAEGYGKRALADRVRFYDIARASAHECGAVLDASKVLGIIDDEAYV